jgi:hypothetical protein
LLASRKRWLLVLLQHGEKKQVCCGQKCKKEEKMGRVPESQQDN